MNRKAKPYLEAQKSSVLTKLDARRALLKERGLNEEAIRKDVTMKKLKADLRKSDFRLASVAAQEKISRDVAQAKAEKAAAAKAPKKESPVEAPAKKEKKEKKEKKPKKEKTEQQAQSETSS